ncbi:hypothetical protein AJ80_06581 [Polytolypa hystricis UAMH7299]|uniref:GAR domain-containing protein n=1 Tax=Polytolypa hystricis (strain UAMH7299) TaxID=1447883 RepID=A0A2B7XW77_POLH7|nr:hypothetical protein AJ80_06581 [Polytolypa hystricis UAMH7299]
MAEHPFKPLPLTLRLTPARTRPHSRSPSRSPERISQIFGPEFDPLLASLSPEATLKALSATDAVPSNEKAAHDILSKSIAQVSQAERALGVRAALAAQKLKEWYKEVSSWDWPRKRDAGLGKGFLPPKRARASPGPTSSPCTDRNGDAYLGCLAAGVVEQYENRIDEIKDGMDALDVEELKEHVLNAHIPSRSRPSSSTSSSSNNSRPLSYVQLSDFTTVITATILQALPLLSKLNLVLNTWDVRLLVLHQIPALLNGLENTKIAIDMAMERLENGLLPGLDDPLFSKESFSAARGKLEVAVLKVGSKMDSILDALEGREDSLPESWIDDMETIESRFATWAFEAEKRALENEWRRTLVSSTPPAPAEEDKSATPENEALKVETLRSPSQSMPPEQGDPAGATAQPESHTKPQTPTSSNSVHPLSTNQSIPPVISTIFVPDNVQPSPPSQPHAEKNVESDPSTELQVAKTEKITPDSTPLPDTAPSSSPSDAPTACNTLSQVDEPVCSLDPPGPIQPHAAGLLPSVESSSNEKEQPKIDDDENPQSLPPIGLDSPTSHCELTKPHRESAMDAASKKPVELPAESTRRDTGGSEDKAQEVDAACDIPETPLADVPIVPSPEDRHPRRELASPIEASSSTRIPQVDVSLIAKPLQPADGAAARHIPRIEETATCRSRSPSPVSPKHSPSKVTKTKPHPLKLAAATHGHNRRDSTLSASSIGTGYLSYDSTIEINDAQVAESHGSPIVVESPLFPATAARKSGLFSQIIEESHPLQNENTRDNSDKMTCESRPPVQRSMSLPLERFIDGQFAIQPNGRSSTEIKQAASTSIEVLPKSELRSIVLPRRSSFIPPSEERTIPKIRRSVSTLALSSLSRLSGKSFNFHSKQQQPQQSRNSLMVPSSGANITRIPVRGDSLVVPPPKSERRSSIVPSPKTPTHPPIPPRSSKRISRIVSPSVPAPSHKRNSATSIPASALPGRVSALASPTSVPSPTARSSEDQLEEKISSILTTIPARIHLESTPDRHASPASDTNHARTPPNKAPQRTVSPTPTRSSTPTPSLTLRPAFGRAKQHHAHPDNDSAGRLYHLHRGEKAAPIKLFVRSVGEDGERVMVRVGGGWADLAEYLREYVAHHGRRRVSDSRFEIKDLASTNNNSGSSRYSSNGRLAPAPVPRSGRTTPISRPGSALDVRPSSSLAVRKTRRLTSTQAERPTLTAANIEKASEGSGPLSFLSSRRRLSISSNASMSVASTVGDSPYASTPPSVYTPNSHSTPLGLAGPKPRARQISMSPESEAWVEDVMGRARRTSSSLQPKKSLNSLRALLHKPDHDDNAKRLQRVSDISSISLNKRVFLRGLDKGKN